MYGRMCAGRPVGKWLCWDGKRFAIDNQRVVEALAKKVADAIWQWLGAPTQNSTDSERVAMLRWATYTASKRGIDNMLALVRSEPNIAVLAKQLDAHPWLFNARTA